MLNENVVTPNEESKLKEAGMKPGVKKPSFVKKYPVVTTVLFGLLAVVIVFFWKDIEGNYEKKAVIKAASAQLLENNRQSLMVLSKPLAWSIRSEMMRGNMEQVDLLISDLVKERNFQFIHILGLDGNVVLSTNKKLEGMPVDIVSVNDALPNDSTVVINEADDVVVVVTPVMGYDSKLGTLVFGCKTVVPEFK